MTDNLPRSEKYTSRLDISYSDLSSLNTLDLHFPTNPAPDHGLWLIWIHGGAFRDPTKTSRSILPTLPHLFNPSSEHYQPLIHGVASLNYRLSPYPRHPTDPSRPGDPARSARWPGHIEDVKAGIAWALEHGDDGEKESSQTRANERRNRRYILAGHSVGATMAMLTAQSEPAHLTIPLPLAIIPICGIFNFASLRDAHPEHKDIYNDFTTAAFGPEDEGGWERGNCTKRDINEEVKVVVMAHGKEDTLVDWGQAEEMSDVLEKVNKENPNAKVSPRKAVIAEVKGDHDEVWERGIRVAQCVQMTVTLLTERGFL